MNDIPPPPPGFTLLTDGAIPPPPPGFTLIDDAPRAPTGLERAGRFLDNVVRGVAQGATLGFMDEIAAAARTGAGMWGNYGEALAQERARDAEFRRESPVASTVANIAGGIASPAGRIAAFNPARAASLPGAMVRGGAGGVALGGTAGFGEGEGGVADRVMNAANGAVIGGTVGAALPPVIRGAGAVGGAVGRRLGLTSGDTDAERIILRSASRDGVTPEQMLQRSREAGAAPVAVADLGGEDVAGMAAAVARLPGEGRTQAGRMVAERGGRAQSERLAGMVRGAISGDDFAEGVNAVAQRRAAQARPLYEEAYSVPLPRDPRLERFLADPDVMAGIRSGLESVRREALTEGVPFDPASLGVRIGRNGQVQLTGNGAPTRLIDAAKRGLDELIEASRGENGRATARTRELTRLRNAMLTEVDRLNPAFAQARAAFAGQSELLDAARIGRDLLDMRPGDFQAIIPDIRSMSDQQREFLRLGVARGLLDRIERATDAQELTRLNRLAGSTDLRNRIGLTLNDPRELNAFMAQFERELAIARNNALIGPRGGSQTAPLTERVADLRSPPSGGLMGDPAANAQRGGVVRDMLTTGRTAGATATAFRLGERVADAMAQSRLERNTNALAPMLFNPDQRAREEVLRQLIQREARDRVTQRVVNPALSGLGRGAAVGGSLYVNE